MSNSIGRHESQNSSVNWDAIASIPAFVPYEQRLNSDKEWGMNDASLFFEGKGKVHETLNRLTRELNERSISYAIVGGLSLFEYGFRRFTEDVDLLVTKPDLRRIHEELEDCGYLKPFSQSKNLRDTTTGVKIDFLITGDYPGDGKPGPFAFPNPVDVVESHRDKKYATLPTIIAMKIASGLSGKDRSKDFVDVEGLIRACHLPLAFYEELPDYVRQNATNFGTNRIPNPQNM